MNTLPRFDPVFLLEFQISAHETLMRCRVFREIVISLYIVITHSPIAINHLLVLKSCLQLCICVWIRPGIIMESSQFNEINRACLGLKTLVFRNQKFYKIRSQFLSIMHFLHESYKFVQESQILQVSHNVEHFLQESDNI